MKKLYQINGEFKCGNFIIRVKDHDVVEYIPNERLVYQSGIVKSTWIHPSIDEYRIGGVLSTNPSMTIYTMDEFKVEKYKEEIKSKMTELLTDGINRLKEFVEKINASTMETEENNDQHC